MEPRLIDYVWISYYDEILEKRFSDWAHAKQCEECGHGIVHVYFVEDVKGVHVVGKECAHIKLGWWERHDKRLKLVVSRLLEKKKREEEITKEVMRSIETYGTFVRPEEAYANCDRRNNGKCSGITVMCCKSPSPHYGRHYAIPNQCAERIVILRRMGWIVV